MDVMISGGRLVIVFLSVDCGLDMVGWIIAVRVLTV